MGTAVVPMFSRNKYEEECRGTVLRRGCDWAIVWMQANQVWAAGRVSCGQSRWKDVSYEKWRQLWAEIGANVFMGNEPHTMLGALDRNDNVYLTIRHGF